MAADVFDLSAFLRDRYGLDLREFAGATASGRLPVTDAAINRALADRLVNHPHLASVRIEAQEDDWAVIHVVTRSRFVPALRATARIERQPQLPDDPTLLVQWSIPSAGPLGWLAGPIVSYFTNLPPGIQLSGDRIAIDLRQLLRARGLEGALMFVRTLAVHTTPGAFVAHFEVSISA